MGLKIGDQTVFRKTVQWNGDDSLSQETSIHFDSLANYSHIKVLEEEHHPSFKAHQDRLNSTISQGNETNNETPQSYDGGAQAAVEATKLAWDIIKDAKPIVSTSGEFTSILNSLDKNWVHYENAKKLESKEVNIYTKNGFGTINTDVRFTVQGTYSGSYAGQNPGIAKGGNYIPNIHVVFSHVSAGATWNINATASVSSTSNLGTVNDVNAYTVVKIDLAYSGWFQAFHKSYLFDVSGEGGVIDITLPPDGI